jgi:hypothetical protein
MADAGCRLNSNDAQWPEADIWRRGKARRPVRRYTHSTFT